MHMNIFPKTRDEWIALPLFPFKAWVIIGFVFYLFARALVFGQYARHGTGEFGMMVMSGYVLSVPVLLVGALIQRNFSERREAEKTVLYALAAVALLLNFLLLQ